jgi:molybdenum cofactor cytidylyltransferase
MTDVAAIVLAAGRASRFRAAGGEAATKLVAALDGEPIARRVVATALNSRARPVIVVVGHAREAVEAALANLAVTLRFNPDFADGLATSLRAGLAATPPGVAGALILLGDMPGIGAPLLDDLIRAFAAKPRALAAAPVRAGKRGNPVLLGRALFDAAMRLEGDEGARRLINALDRGQIAEVETAAEGIELDIDTPDDLKAARDRGGR